MYGEYFLGHLCAEKCLSKRGKFKAVCNSLHSIKPFLNLGMLDDDEDDSEDVLN